MNSLVTSWVGDFRGEIELPLYVEMEQFLTESDERSARQLAGGISWLRAECRGTLEWCTGMGKTRAAIRLIALLRREDPTRRVIVTVPTSYLQQQWLNALKVSKQHEHTEVVVINSLVKRHWVCDLLICDEIHRMAADSFRKVFSCVRYDFILGLTATLARLDGRHDILKAHCPIVDKITATQARSRGYISAYREYNLGVEMDEVDRHMYREWIKSYDSMMDKFNQDFDTMKKCSMGHSPGYDADREIWYEPKAVKVARTHGWRGNTPLQASLAIELNKTRPRGQKVSVWGGNLTHFYHPDKIVGFAVNGMRLGRLITEFIYNHPLKTKVVSEICNAIRVKSIVFSERIATADAVGLEIDRAEAGRALRYYSKAKNYMLEDGTKVPAKEVKTFIAGLMNDTPFPYVLCTARALDQGADFPSLILGVTHSRSSSPTQHTQRLGRVTRKNDVDGRAKDAIFVNVYVKDTKDVFWMSKGQKGLVGIKWIDSVEELLTAETRENQLVI